MRRAIIYLLLGIVVFILCFALIRYLPIPKNANMPMWFLETRISDIVRGYGKISSTCSFIQQDELSWCIEATNKNRKKLSDLNEDQGILYIEFKGKPQEYNKPIEIYAIFEAFLYLNKRTTPKEIVAITCISESGEYFDANSTTITITTEEFKSLYNSIDVSNRNNEVIANELATIWANKNFYNRYKLQFDEQELYKAKLVTEWNKRVISYDGDFSIFYGYDTNKLSISKISKADDSNVSMTSSLADFEIEETGFLYATWDKQNNIWLYGEDIGLQMYQYQTDSCWEKAENVIWDNAPVVLKNIASN